MSIELIQSDCIDYLSQVESKKFDAFITSPPYNLKIKYNTYKDSKKREDYLKWIGDVTVEIKRTMKDSGSLFLNVGSSNVDPWIQYDVANVVRESLVLQNNIVWIKSISIDGRTYGHFKPINSKRFTNHTFEHIFHFTKDGNNTIDRLAIGVKYSDKSNIKRWKSASKDIRCRGNCWYIPYETIQLKKQKGNHPAIFPKKLVEYCIKLHGISDDTIICDPFVGTGTTMIVANNLGISGVGIDIDKYYIDFSSGCLNTE